MGDDWDEEETTTTTTTSWNGSASTMTNGTSSSAGSGSTWQPPIGRGRGRGGVGGTNTGQSNYGGSSFAKPSTTSSSVSNGWGGGGDYSSSSGGGNSGSKGGSGECYKCHETGHFARECPNADSGSRGGGGGGECYKCHETGHFARECPNADSGSRGGGGGGECYKCHETGHFARECPNADSGSRGGGGGGSECYKCHKTGHFARECPDADSSGGRTASCYKCGQSGHAARNCAGTVPRYRKAQGGGGGSGSGECHRCHKTGHFARECPEAGTTEDGEARPPPSTYIPPEPSEEEAQMFDSMQRGINFDKYDDIPVEVTGRDPPKCITSFHIDCLCQSVKDNVAKAKYEKPTPVQKYGIPIISAGRDLMACAQTGSGKTAAFLLPIISQMLENGVEGSLFSEYQAPQCIIISPTRELTYQIFTEAFKFSRNTMLRPVVIYGGTSVSHQMREVEKGCHLLVATPGRLKDFIRRGKIRLNKCKFFVLDEADRMLDMGFGPDIQEIVGNPEMAAKGARQFLMFSATFPNEVQLKAADYLNDYLFLTVGRVGGATPDITQTILEVSQYDKKEKLMDILRNQPAEDLTLVFLETKRSADFLATYLSQEQLPATSIHGDREQREREEALRDFRSGRARILVATSVAARGLDISGVKHVVNYDLPSSIEEYVHRIGRTGRVGHLGKATSFYDSNKDSQNARALIKVLADAHQDVPEFLENAADSAVGTFHGNVGGSFGGRDTRKQFSGRGGGRGGGYGGGSGGGGGGYEQQNDWNSGGNAGNDNGGDGESWD